MVGNRNIWRAILVAVVLLIVGVFFIDNNPWLGYTESAVLYLSAIVGAGCYWIGSNQDK